MRIAKAFSAALVTCILLALAACEIQPTKEGALSGVNPLEEKLRMPASIARQEGIAAAILMDTSGSMDDSVLGADGKKEPKIEIARRAVLNLVGQFHDFVSKNPERRVLLGVYEFSSRDREPASRQVIPLGPPDPAAAATAIGAMVAEGGTPIGDAMIAAKRDLDASGMSRRHILVVSDGENNRGYKPSEVASVIARLPEEERVAIYFVAFDVSADVFKGVKDAGGLVLGAVNEGDLRQTLDFILTGKILAEQPTK